MTSTVQMHTAGTTRLTLCVARFALKFAKGRRGRNANRRELREWDLAKSTRREMLCPILWAAPLGLVIVMRRAIPLTRHEQLALLDYDGFPDWDYVPGDRSSPFEFKESDWGRLDGRLVALDYAGGDND